MMNNGMPVNPMQLMQMLKGGVNPNQLAGQLIQRNPAFRQAAQFMNGKTPQQIRQEARQLAAQRGVDLNQLARSLGIQLPK